MRSVTARIRSSLQDIPYEKIDPRHFFLDLFTLGTR
jgi:hypothetical protein